MSKADTSELWSSVVNSTTEATRDRIGLREDQHPAVWLLRLGEAATGIPIEKQPDVEPGNRPMPVLVTRWTLARECVERWRGSETHLDIRERVLALGDDANPVELAEIVPDDVELWCDQCHTHVEHVIQFDMSGGGPARICEPCITAAFAMTPSVAAHEPPPTLSKRLQSLLNSHSCENASDTPDWILAEMLLGVLEVWNKSTKAREAFYGRPCGNGASIVGETRVIQEDPPSDPGGVRGLAARSEADIRKRLAGLQSRIEEVWQETMRRGWGLGQSVIWDEMIKERSLLRWVLGDGPPTCEDPKYQDQINAKWEHEP